MAIVQRDGNRKSGQIAQPITAEILAEVQQMHACLDAMDDDRHLGWMWTVTWTLVGFTLGLLIAAIWL